MRQFSLKWDIVKEIPVVYLSGDITYEADPLLCSVYHEIRKSSKAKVYIFDFKDCTYVNSSGISSFIKLIHLHKEINGNFIFTGLTEHLYRVMDIVGITEYIDSIESIDKALQKIHKID